MSVPAPHFLLFSESNRKQPQGQWRFVLQSVDGSEVLEAVDDEPGLHPERLELLAVVRGLEALSQPSRVTLVTPSKYVNRGLAYGLAEWRTNGWQWEHFGEMAPVKNRDLWQRVDRALQFHDLECRTWRFDLPHGAADEFPCSSTDPNDRGRPTRLRRRSVNSRLRRWRVRSRRKAERWAESCRLWTAQLGTRFAPLPWLQ